MLIAEDNPVNRSLIEGQLAGMQCPATIVDDGLQAWEQLERQRFDLLITDIRMPGLDGYELALRIRERALCARNDAALPILALTASVEQSELERCADSGVDEVLPKPLTLRRLSEALQQWLPEAPPD